VHSRLAYIWSAEFRIEAFLTWIPSFHPFLQILQSDQINVIPETAQSVWIRGMYFSFVAGWMDCCFLIYIVLYRVLTRNTAVFNQYLTAIDGPWFRSWKLLS